VLPALLVTAGFLGYPIVRTVWLSFYDWNGLDPVMRFVGFGNYRELATQDPYFWTAVKNTLIWAAVTVPLELLIGLTLALLLDSGLRGRVIFRTIFFLPVVMSPVVIAIAWGAIYNPSYGFMNSLTRFLGLGTHGWLGDPNLALPAAMLASIWRYSGLIMIFYLAALQTIPGSLYEAATVDGASTWTRTRRITLPLLKPMTALLVLLGTIGALREFDMIWILTGGGPAHASDLLSTQVFSQSFTLFHAGYASSIATIMLLFTIILAVIQLGYLARAHRSVGA